MQLHVSGALPAKSGAAPDSTVRIRSGKRGLHSCEFGPAAKAVPCRSLQLACCLHRACYQGGSLAGAGAASTPGFSRCSVTALLSQIICNTFCWLQCTRTPTATHFSTVAGADILRTGSHRHLQHPRNSLLKDCPLQTHRRLVATGTQRPPATTWQPPGSSCSSTASLQPAMELQRCRSRACGPQLHCPPPPEPSLCSLRLCSSQAVYLAGTQCPQLTAGSGSQRLSFRGGPACWQKHQLHRLAVCSKPVSIYLLSNVP